MRFAILAISSKQKGLPKNEECRECKYRLACGAGCRAQACGETGTDYLGIDEDHCRFFKNGWYEKALELKEKYEDLMIRTHY